MLPSQLSVLLGLCRGNRTG